MEEQLVSFETAKLAKEKGFNIYNMHWYNSIGNLTGTLGTKTYYKSNHNEYNLRENVYAPTQSLLQKWLREVYNCFIDILPHRDGDSKNKQWKSKKDVFWSVEVDYYGKDFKIELTDDADFTQHFNNSYEEALEIGLQEALKLIKK